MPQEKDAPFAHTIATVTDGLAAAGIQLTFTSQQQGLPGSWSHHLQAAACPLLTTNGKGSSEEASRASALGEFVERLGSGLFFVDYALEGGDGFYFHPDEVRLKPGNPAKPVRRQKFDRRLLTPELLEFYDPEGELMPEQLLDGNFDAPERGILALPFSRLGGDAVACFPLALLNSLYLSNGMAAGNSREEALAQALCEIFERHVKYQVIAEAISLPDLPPQMLEKFPDEAAKVAELQQHALVKIKDASLGGAFPVVAIFLLLPDGGAFASFGCSPRLEVALARALNELVQGRTVKTLQGLPHPAMEMEEYAAAENLAAHFINSVGVLPLRLFLAEADLPCALSPWEFTGNSTAELAFLLKLLEESEHEAWCREVTGLPLHVCQLVVPGMSEVYPVDELLYASRTKTLKLRPQLPQLAKMKGKKLDGFLHRLEECEAMDSDRVTAALGLAVAEESAWGRLTFGQLKAMAWLSRCSRGGLEDEALERALTEAHRWCRWTAQFGRLPQAESRLYEVLSLLVGITYEEEENGYDEALQAMTTPEELACARAILAGEQRFYGLHFSPLQELNETAQSLAEMWQLYRKLVQPSGVPG